MDNLSKCKSEAEAMGLTYGQYMAWKDREKLDAEIEAWYRAMKEEAREMAAEKQAREQLKAIRLEKRKALLDEQEAVFWGCFAAFTGRAPLAYPLYRVRSIIEHEREIAEYSQNASGVDTFKKALQILRHHIGEARAYEDAGNRRCCLWCGREYLLNPNGLFGMRRRTGRDYCSKFCSDGAFEYRKEVRRKELWEQRIKRNAARRW